MTVTVDVTYLSHNVNSQPFFFFFLPLCFPVMFFGKSIFHRFLYRTPPPGKDA